MKDKNDAHLAELQTIRKLMVLALLRSGMSQSQLGAALGIHQTQIGRMFPSGALATFSKKPVKGKKASSETEVGDA